MNIICEHCGMQINPTANTHVCQSVGTATNFRIFSDGTNPPIMTGGNTGALTPLGEALQSNYLSDFSGSIYKHIVYNPHMRNIDAVINQAQEDGKDWQFSHAQPVTEYEWVAVFEKWIS